MLSRGGAEDERRDVVRLGRAEETVVAGLRPSVCWRAIFRAPPAFCTAALLAAVIGLPVPAHTSTDALETSRIEPVAVAVAKSPSARRRRRHSLPAQVGRPVAAATRRADTRPTGSRKGAAVPFAHEALYRKVRANNLSVLADELVYGMVMTESRGKASARGKGGERGLMQVKQGTWKDITKVPWYRAFDPETNIRVATEYLNWITRYFERHGKRPVPHLVIAAYNCGPTRLRKSGWRLSNCPERTRAYVKKVFTTAGMAVPAGDM